MTEYSVLVYCFIVEKQKLKILLAVNRSVMKCK